MIDEEAATFEAFLSILERVPATSHIYRGLRRANLPLTPKVGRNFQPTPRDTAPPEVLRLRLERALFREFKREARAFVSGGHSELELLALAQHHGVPTRLLDWTWNPLAALYFALDPSRDDKKDPAAVYAVSAGRVTWVEDDDEDLHPNWHESGVLVKTPPHDPGALRHVMAYTPPRFSPRIAAQSSVFTMHALPWQELNDDAITRITIPVASKTKMRELLFAFDVTPRSLFRDLDGLGAFLTMARFPAATKP